MAAIVAVVAILMGAETAQAQGRGPGRQGGPGMQQQMMEAMFKGITLSDAQKAKVDSIVEATRAEMPAMTPGQRPSQEDRDKRMAVMQKQRNSIREVLTDAQKVQFDKNLADMPQRRP